MAEKDAFLDIVGYSPQMKIMGILLTGRGLDYSATGIINAAEIGRATFYAIFPKLLKQELVVTTRKVGNIQLYALNQKNPAAQQLLRLYKQALLNAMKKHLPVEVKPIKTSARAEKETLIEA